MGKCLGHDICTVRSPEAIIGIPPPEDARQRVIQVALGIEHGLLLTDAGIACTWGDNRYGQLGRNLCLKEENGQPFPVAKIQHDEITMIASGKHHCLALAAAGHVWAWGRNKAGQLGLGNVRDKISPETVKLPNGRDVDKPFKVLGEKKGCQIISIAAGCNSSVASSLNSNVWQWGEISTDFHEPTDQQKKGGKTGVVSYFDGRQFAKNIPHLIFSQTAYRTQLRTQKDGISITETGCRVLPHDLQARQGESIKIPPDLNKVKGIVMQVRQLRDKIAADRRELSTKAQQIEEKNGAQGGQDAGNDHRSLQDTIHMFQHIIIELNKKISETEKDMLSCELQQEHNRMQLANNSLQSTKLNREQDDASLDLSRSRRGAAGRKQQEKRLANIHEFSEANQNTRMTLLDQRAETDKNKQHVSQKLYQYKKERADVQRHLDTVKEMGNSKAMNQTISSSDDDIQFLRERNLEIKKVLDAGDENEPDFVAKKAGFEADRRFLDSIEVQAQDRLSISPNAGRAKVVCALLQDIVDLRRRAIQIKEDRLLSEDLDISFFWKEQARRLAGSS